MSIDSNQEPQERPTWRTVVGVALMAFVATVILLYANQAPVVLYQAF